MRIGDAVEVTYHSLILDHRNWCAGVTDLAEYTGVSCAAHFF